MFHIASLSLLPRPHPVFQMANGSRKLPTEQLNDKLKALLLGLKVAPVQQREKETEKHTHSFSQKVQNDE